MPNTENLINQTNAAEHLECSRTTVWRAMNDGRLNTKQVNGQRMVIQNERYYSFQPAETGGRTNHDSDMSDITLSGMVDAVEARGWDWRIQPGINDQPYEATVWRGMHGYSHEDTTPTAALRAAYEKALEHDA